MGSIVSQAAFPAPPPSELPDECVKVTTKNGHIIPIYVAENKKAEFTVIYSHGNAEDLGCSIDMLEDYASVFNCNVVGYEYPGYGYASHTSSEKKPTSEEGIFEAIESTYDYLLNKKNIPPEKIIAFGRSLGSGPTCHLASHYPLQGVILQSPLLSCVRVITETYANMWFDIMVNQDKIGKIRAKVCIIHGTEDEVISCHHGKDLYEKVHKDFRSEPLWIKGAGHNNIETSYWEVLVSHISKFISSLDSSFKVKSPKKGTNLFSFSK